jgi:hypothetical protein
LSASSGRSGASTSNDDPFFALTGDANWNAFIGKQGEEEYYIDGYIDAALELSGTLIAKKLYGQQDTLVLPILYNARHGVELTLKYVIENLHDAGALNHERPRNHDIATHHAALSNAKLPDERLRELVGVLGPFIKSLCSIDEDGQMLRYHETQGGQQSLADRALINMQVVDRGLKRLSEILRTLRFSVDDFKSDRKTGTYTKECSRADLMQIAKILSSEARTEQGIDVARQRVKARYGIGREKFSAVTRLIDAHREMGSMLGNKFELLHVTDEHLMFAVQQWDKRFPLQASDDNPGVPTFSAWVEYAELAKRANTPIVKTLTVDEIADLVALYNIGRESSPSEYYEEWVKDMRAAIVARNDIYMSVGDLTGKTNFAAALTKGLKIVGRQDLAEQVRNRKRT